MPGHQQILRAGSKDVKKQLTELEEGIAPPFTMKDEYFNRIWRRDKILKDIIGQDLLAATGEVDYNQINADIIREKTLENLLILQESPAESQRAALAQSRIKQINFVEPDDKRYLKQELSIQTYQSLLDVNFDMVKWNDTYSANTNDVDTSIIRELQTSLWLQDGTSKAFIAGDAIVAQLKLLNL